MLSSSDLAAALPIGEGLAAIFALILLQIVLRRRAAEQEARKAPSTES